MRRILLLLSMFLLFCAPGALAAEGDPLLSVDDLLSLEDSYTAFLDELEALIVARGLLSEEERGAWRDAQLGDFFSNGGYGSIMANYLPGVLGYIRDEDTLTRLSVPIAGGMTLQVDTMRRYTPQDSTLSGLMLTMSLTDESGLPVIAQFALTGTSGVFLKWDALLGAYVSVGARADSNGEIVVWSDQTPLPEAKNPAITIAVTDPAAQAPLGSATLTLTVDGEGYVVGDGALKAN